MSQDLILDDGRVVVDEDFLDGHGRNLQERAQGPVGGRTDADPPVILTPPQQRREGPRSTKGQDPAHGDPKPGQHGEGEVLKTPPGLQTSPEDPCD